MSVTLLALALSGCTGSEPEAPEAPPAPEASAPLPDLVLITLDTTRADALGCYGGPSALPSAEPRRVSRRRSDGRVLVGRPGPADRGPPGADDGDGGPEDAPGPGPWSESATPTLDGIAAGGARFAWALAHAPTTLSSHASMFTGLDPHGHAIPKNGYPLSTELPTLAERLSAVGYETLAVIGSSALAPETGILRGFSRYDATLSVDMERRFEDPGDRVTARALALLRERERERPLFLWVHYFDAHSPYAPPDEHAAPFVAPDYAPSVSMSEGLGPAFTRGAATQADLEHVRGLYQGEVRFVDAQIEALLQALRSDGILEDGALIVAGDHGEMFFEDRLRPLGHGPDVDVPVTRVPLIIEGYGGVEVPPRVIDQPVKLSDLPATALGLLGLEGALGTGQDLGPLLRGEPMSGAPIFLEATRPGSTRGGLNRWNNLQNERGVAWGDHLVLADPRRKIGPTLYSLDPEQEPTADADRFRELTWALEAWDAKAPPFREKEMSDEMEEALRALGYIE